MALGQILSIFSAIVGVALATVIVTSPHTADIIRAFGSSFSGALQAAMGR